MHLHLRALLQRPQGLPDGEALGADIKDEAAQHCMQPTVLTRRVPKLLLRRHHLSGRKGWASQPSGG